MRSFSLPELISKQLFPAPKQRIPAHAKLRPLARNGKQRLRFFVTSLTQTCDIVFEPRRLHEFANNS